MRPPVHPPLYLLQPRFPPGRSDQNPHPNYNGGFRPRNPYNYVPFFNPTGNPNVHLSPNPTLIYNQYHHQNQPIGNSPPLKPTPVTDHPPFVNMSPSVQPRKYMAPQRSEIETHGGDDSENLSTSIPHGDLRPRLFENRRVKRKARLKTLAQKEGVPSGSTLATTTPVPEALSPPQAAVMDASTPTLPVPTSQPSPSPLLQIPSPSPLLASSPPPSFPVLSSPLASLPPLPELPSPPESTGKPGEYDHDKVQPPGKCISQKKSKVLPKGEGDSDSSRTNMHVGDLRLKLNDKSGLKRKFEQKSPLQEQETDNKRESRKHPNGISVADATSTPSLPHVQEIATMTSPPTELPELLSSPSPSKLPQLTSPSKLSQLTSPSPSKLPHLVSPWPLQSIQESFELDHERERTGDLDLHGTPVTNSIPPPLLASPQPLQSIEEASELDHERKSTGDHDLLGTPVINSALLSWLSSFDYTQRKVTGLPISPPSGPSDKNEDLLEPAPLGFGDSLEATFDELSSPEESKTETTPLSRLEPPKSHKSNKSNLSQERMSLVSPVVSLLVLELTKASSGVNQMIDLANHSFRYLDSLGVDYTPLYEAIRSFISYHYDRKEAERERDGHAFSIRDQHRELLAKLCDAEEALSQSDTDLIKALEKLVPLRARVEVLKENLEEAMEKMEEGEAEVAAMKAKKKYHAEAYSSVEQELLQVLPLMDEAEMVIKDVEERWENAADGINRMRNELLLLKK